MPKTPIKKLIVSKLTGAILQDQIFMHWWRSDKINIPFFGNTKLEVIYINEEPDHTNEFIKRADKTLSRFINIDSTNRLLISTIVNEQYTNFLLQKKNQNEKQTNGIISHMDDIWHYIKPTYIYLEKGKALSNKTVITIICECLLDNDFKLQLRVEYARKHLKIVAEYEHIIQLIIHCDEVITKSVIEPSFENVLL